jgi:hypothetical protein
MKIIENKENKRKYKMKEKSRKIEGIKGKYLVSFSLFPFDFPSIYFHFLYFSK